MSRLLRIFRYACLTLLIMVASSAAIHADDGQRVTPVVKVIKEWVPSVVNISTERTVLLQTHPFWRDYGRIFDEAQIPFPHKTIGTLNLKNLGSGVVVLENGLILTNAHVVNMASKIYVTFYDGTRKEATIAGMNQQDDLALIEVDSSPKIKPVKLAKDVMIGETIIAIGNPLGLENSVTVGVVSGLNRQISDSTTGLAIFKGLIQTDAPVNPGSSGGALLNLDGELVGINLAVVQSAQSISVAISFAKIKSLLDEYERLKSDEYVTRILVK